MKYVVGIDLGTTGIKCVLYDEGLRTRKELHTEYGLITLSPTEIEQDADTWWDSICVMLREICEEYGSEDITAVGVSSQGISELPVDGDFNPLCNAISWLDRRAGTEGAEVFNQITPERFRQITARMTPAFYGAAKIAWIGNNRPDIAAKAAYYLMPLDYITTRLCGKAVTDHSMAAGSCAYDLAGRCWSEEILDAYAIDRAKLPEIRDSGTVAGCVTREAAASTGLREGTVVAVGAQDQKCGALGAGLGSGVATLSMGTAFALTIKSDCITEAADGFIPPFNDILGSGFLLESCIITGGAALKWWRDGFVPEKDYRDLDENVSGYEPQLSSPFCFPHFSGCGHPHSYPDSSACFHGVTLDSTKDSMLYALMEGLAFAVRQNLDATGQQANCLRAFGGGAKSDVWLQLISDVCGVPVQALANSETACLGAAMLAMIAAGSGTREQCAALAEEVCPVRKTFTPRRQRKELYDRRYDFFQRMERRIYEPINSSEG